MQQATVSRQDVAAPRGPEASASRFVINLCASTSPVALTPPDHAGLKRFTFFVSRRREEGRERFRLHMGYFETQEEAEKLLDIVREIYPAAWAGIAPGQRLRAGAPAPAPASVPEPTVPEPVASAASAASAAPAAPPAAPTTVSAAVDGEVSFTFEPEPELPVAPKPQPATVAAEPAAAAPAAAAPAAPAAPTTPALSLVPDEGRRSPSALDLESEAAARSLHDVRAAIAALDDSGVSVPAAPVLRPLPELKPRAGGAARVPAVNGTPAPSRVPPSVPTISARSTGPAAQRKAPAESGAPRDAELHGEAALRVLESSAAAPSAGPGPGARAAAVPQGRTEKPFYAVQLLWSVQPIEMGQVPQLAIFSAYTLYGAEGNRDGRRWYGLRLGFFTDTVSAKQVAHYVRSEFTSVSVVPVTARERERAKFAVTRPQVSATPAGARTDDGKASKAEFEFIEDKKAPAAAKAGPTRPGLAPLRGSRSAPGKRAKLRPGVQPPVNARAKARPMTLEETLEILGAGELRVDEGREASINDSGVRHLQLSPVRAKQSSRLGRLFERLSERLNN